MATIRAVVFDLDGVVRQFDEAHTTAIETRHGLAPGAVVDAAFEPELLAQVTTGRISRRTWVGRVAKTLGSTAAAEEWGRQPSEVDTEVLDIADALRAAGIRTAILTNGTDTIPAEAEQLGLTAHFDAIFNSAEIGWAKPDARAFQHVLDALGLAASEVFFTDDSASKLVGAVEVGMLTHRFTSAEGLRGALRAVGVLG
ncbi:HAD family phosphatase [Microbacterium sp. W4I20]|uniref:HAD family hydrolase n=1 Tax=Microbacterium sp. W4I20 TaxID=3042262 RepID=UPI00278722D3|nr:HAD family phosphatase [Microbacterium sp. W4I20]MDQ0727239.1 HAD superfamily hydrolase (TIGR01509 family) [Microbacterium sp. W4I20]